MPALPRTYFDSPTPAVDMTGWSEERRRFFMLNGYDRGPATPETTVKVTETPPDDPTPTTRVTTTKYPEGMEQPGMQGLGLLGDLQDTTPDPLAMHQQAGRDFHQTDVLQPTDPSLRLSEQDDIAGSYDRPQIQHPFLPAYDDPVTSRDEFDLAMEGRAPSGGMIIHREDDGTPVTFDDLMLDLDPLWLVGGLGAATKLPAIIMRAGGLRPFIQKNLGRLRDIARRKGAKPAAQAGSKIDYGLGFTDKQLARAAAQGRILRNAETAALIGTGVAGGTAVGLLGQPEEEGPYYEGYSPVLEEGRGAPAEESGTTTEQIVGDYEGLLVGQEDDSGIPITAQTGFITKSEVDDTSREDAASKQAELDRYYANFPEDIEGKRERYLKALKEIYKKVAILNVIAALTNSPSQAGQFMQMAAEKFKTLEGFRGEERLQKIARGVFFKENGEFDAPASKQDAFNRAMRFGANHDEALALSGHKREETARTTPTGYQIWSNEATGQQTYLPKGEVPPGEGWLPRAAPAETKGTAFERITSQASKLIGDGNVEQAVSLLSYWLMGKDSMLRDFLGAEEADTIARSMVERLSKQLDADPVAIAAELGIDTGGQGVTTAQPSNPRRPR